jgi:hypothetical protein
MAMNNTGDWRELFDIALFEPNRTRLRQSIEHAKHAINDRLDVLTLAVLTNDVLTNDRSESGRILSERIALSDALITLAELHKMVYARKPNSSIRRQDHRPAGQADLS